MAARTPRRSFAAPFVVTLAAAPACYVQPVQQGPQGPQGPRQPPPTQTAEPTNPQQQPPVVINPPRPMPPQTQPQTPPPQPQPQPQPPPQPQPASTTSKWTVYKAKDGSCMAGIKVTCPAGAMCNPPPPFKYACPPNVSLDAPVTVATYDGGATCNVEFAAPKCPPNTACNPPRPQPVTCPKP